MPISKQIVLFVGVIVGMVLFRAEPGFGTPGRTFAMLPGAIVGGVAASLLYRAWFEKPRRPPSKPGGERR